MLSDRFERFATTLVALCVVLMASTAPVAATPDDGLLEGDGDGGLVGNATDSVESTTDAVSDTVPGTGDSTLDAGVGDAVESTASSATGDASDTTGDASDTTGDASDTTGDAADATRDASVTGAASTGSGTLDGSVDETVTGHATGVTDGLGLDAGSLPLGAGPLSTYRVPTDAVNRDVRTRDLPVRPDQVPADRIPLTGEDAPVQPEDSPYGSDAHGDFDACTLPVTDDDLPTESVPERGDLPVQPTVPGVPLDLLTPDVVAGLLFGVPPRPCEVYDPHDPSVDPTDLPEDPAAELHTATLYVGTHHVYYHGISRGHLEDGGFSEAARWSAFADDEEVSTMDRIAVSDGREDHYLFVQTWDDVNYRTTSGDGDVRVGIFGQHASADGRCEPADPANASVDVENPTGPCEYGYDGVPTVPAGPETVIDALEDPPQPELPVNLARLPAL